MSATTYNNAQAYGWRAKAGVNPGSAAFATAVQEFQAFHNSAEGFGSPKLSVDGKLGPATWAQVRRYIDFAAQSFGGDLKANWGEFWSQRIEPGAPKQQPGPAPTPAPGPTPSPGPLPGPTPDPAPKPKRAWLWLTGAAAAAAGLYLWLAPESKPKRSRR